MATFGAQIVHISGLAQGGWQRGEVGEGGQGGDVGNQAEFAVTLSFW